MAELLQFMQEPTIARDALVFVVGLCVGSFLNVVALRSLQERSWIIPPSECTQCKHRLGLADLVPVVSYLALKGKCRYCCACISWQYPVVELITAVSFVLVLRHFGFNIEGAGMIIFTCTLIAICITDFREKLIPHEITYPSMFLGIIYSGFCAAVAHTQLLPATHFEHDAIGSLAGVGISYMLFDFIAFYGALAYSKIHPVEEETSEQDDEDPEVDRTFGIPTNEQEEFEEEVEVMGGGDAVLGAVIAAWLGLTRLGTALIFGFLAGTLLGSIYLVIELKRQNRLRMSLWPCLIGGCALATVCETLLYILVHISPAEFVVGGVDPFFLGPWWQLGIISLLCGGLLGIVFSGKRLSKPFPFGPALAAGAVVAMLYDPFTTPTGGA
jgi:prepilin signal peptidase PulO-like enzyme (type II secretory pathway)